MKTLKNEIMELAKQIPHAVDIKPLLDKVGELESKAAKWYDPQTQADLELAAAVKKLFEQDGFCEVEYQIDPSDDESCGTAMIDCKELLITWYKTQKRGAE